MNACNLIYCDGCNPGSVRNIYSNVISIQRNDKGNAWYDGSIEDAVKLGWVVSNQGFTLCPNCIRKSLNEMFRDNQLDVDELEYYFEKFSCKLS